MKKGKIYILRFFIIILIIAWMRLVFGFSNQNATDSSSLSLWVASFFTKDANLQSFLEPIIRKLAHFSEYALGGGLFFSLFATFNISNKKRILYSSILGWLYAITDEIHQIFIDGRSGEIRDVIIDTLGVVSGTILMCFIISVLKNKRKKAN